MKQFYTNIFTIITALLCTTAVFAQTFTDGVIILNEGLFGSPSAAISYIDSSGNLTNDVYDSQNSGLDLGNTAQGMGFNGDYAYVVLNGSNAVSVLNRSTLTLVTTITSQMSNPRNIAFSGGFGYVTNWGDGGSTTDDYVAVIDLSNNTVTTTIPVAEGPEEILEQNGKLYVAHQGGFGFGNSISVIDTTDNSIETVAVGDVPSALRIDANNLYVLASGKPSYSGDETPGTLSIIPLNDIQNGTQFSFTGTEHPMFLGVDATDIYYTLDGDIYKMALSATSLPASEFIDTAAQGIQVPYSFNKINDTLYLGDAVDYVSNGVVYIYGEDGSFTTQHNVGPLPNAFYNAQEGSLGLNSANTLASISLYPNPATTSFRLKTTENVSVSIIDISGRLVKQVNYEGQAISTEGLQAGIYVIQLEQNGKTSTQKLIVR